MKQPTLSESLDYLRHIEHYQALVSYLRAEYEQTIDEMVSASPEGREMLAGAIKTYRQVLEVMDGNLS